MNQPFHPPQQPPPHHAPVHTPLPPAAIGHHAQGQPAVAKKKSGGGCAIAAILVGCLGVPMVLGVVGVAAVVWLRVQAEQEAAAFLNDPLYGGGGYGAYQGPGAYDPYGLGAQGAAYGDPGAGGVGVLGTGAVAPVADTTVHRVPVGSSPQRGPSDALVTIVQFADYQCPFCARSESTLAQLRAQYGNDLRIVYKHYPLPFHADALPAARAAAEARDQKGDEGFWQMHDLLFQNQTALTQADLERYAAQIGLNVPSFRRAMARADHSRAIDADMALGTSAGVQGTPTFFVNGRAINGAQPYEQFVQVVEQELAGARVLEGMGTPRAQIYDLIMATAQ